MKSIAILSTLTLVAMAGCSNGEQQKAPDKEEVATATASNNKCNLVKADSWKAVLDKMPGVDAKGPKLTISGKAYPNADGWKFSFELGALDKSAPPTQSAEFVAIAPPMEPGKGGPGPQDFSTSFDNAQPAYQGVKITCGRMIVATIPVEEVQKK